MYIPLWVSIFFFIASVGAIIAAVALYRHTERAVHLSVQGQVQLRTNFISQAMYAYSAVMAVGVLGALYFMFRIGTSLMFSIY